MYISKAVIYKNWQPAFLTHFFEDVDQWLVLNDYNGYLWIDSLQRTSYNQHDLSIFKTKQGKHTDTFV